MNKKTKNFLINIGTGKDRSIKDYAKFIIKKLDLNVKIKFDKRKPDGVPRKVLDISLANNPIRINVENNEKKFGRTSRILGY